MRKYFYIFGISLIIISGLVIFCLKFLRCQSTNSFPIVGVEKFGNLKIGGKTIEKRKYDIVGMYLQEPSDNEYTCFISGCRYPDPDPPHDFLYAYIDELGGWFLANDQKNSEMVELFGLEQDEVLEGISSLVILTDSKGIIRAIHPNKTSSDALTILSQHADLADVEGLYGK